LEHAIIDYRDIFNVVERSQVWKIWNTEGIDCLKGFLEFILRLTLSEAKRCTYKFNF
jgi:hypothetical protein